MDPSTQMTDLEWAALARDDPNAACRALLQQYGNYIYAIVCNYLRSIAEQEDIEDCVSEVLLSFVQNIDKFSQEHGTLKGYLGTLAKRTAIDAWRKLSKRRCRIFSLDDGDWQETLPSQSAQPDDSAETHAMQRRLWQMVQALGMPDSEILVRQYFYRQTAKEIATAMQLTVGQVQKRSQRARAKLKAHLIAEEIDVSDWHGVSDCKERMEG